MSRKKTPPCTQPQTDQLIMAEIALDVHLVNRLLRTHYGADPFK
jgi:hypothetical protein